MSSGVESSGVEVDVEVEEEVEYVEEYVEEEVDEGEEAEEEEGAASEDGEEDSAKPATAAEEPVPASTEAVDKQEATETEQPASTAANKDHAPEPGSSAPSASASGATGVDLVSLEAQAAKVAAEVSQVASKLTAGFRSAFGAVGGSGGDGGAAETAGASLSKLAGGLTSWWGSLDPQPAPVRDETAERIAQSNKASGELQQLFGLSAEENLVEHFRCKLLQTYACSHNSYTPAIQMAFQGTLYVTDRHTCFSVEERGRKLPFKVPHTSITRATRQRPSRKGDLSDILKLELSNGTWLAFKDFDSGSALDSALALVEHLVEDG
ncbi:hypothetical protein HYH03_017820 [Edaphochlamys debaryana]|uniref:GRAM domain-containing protein n=1 Tax=Edaphochlamys debaryana TaxID=47281 RepID=A0A835XNH0_9CHLO|nr:hypothetical protein HYH03_017820 [Edaphochlamys debaryana]|eukprot:KAG2483319.1 hypothetical protein HYH03_017820 [Edaphochlamys debaryana]